MHAQNYRVVPVQQVHVHPEIHGQNLGRLYWRLALSSIQNIPDVSLSAQRAAEPDNVL